MDLNRLCKMVGETMGEMPEEHLKQLKEAARQKVQEDLSKMPPRERQAIGYHLLQESGVNHGTALAAATRDPDVLQGAIDYVTTEALVLTCRRYKIDPKKLPPKSGRSLQKALVRHIREVVKAHLREHGVEFTDPDCSGD